MTRTALWRLAPFVAVAVAACAEPSPPPAPSPSAAATVAGRTAATPSPQTGTLASSYDWTQVQTATAPLARNSGGFAYDPATHSTLLTGGVSGCGGDPTAYQDNWTFDGTSWTLLHPADNGPAGGRNFAMAYDPNTRQVVAVEQVGGCGIGTMAFTWDGATWTRSTPFGYMPAPLYTETLVYDSDANRLLTVGDAIDGGTGADSAPWAAGPQVWQTTDGHTWSVVARPPSGPPVMDDSVAYDATAHQVVLFGGEQPEGGSGFTGAAESGTWTWSDSGWQKLSPATSPPARVGSAMVYDPDLGGVLLFGGMTAEPNDPRTSPKVLDDMWLWNGTVWAELHPEHMPIGRAFAQITYDSDTHQVLLFGGSLNGQADTNDTWMFGRS